MQQSKCSSNNDKEEKKGLGKASPSTTLLTTVSWLTSPSGATMVCTMNLCLFFSLGSYSNGWSITRNRRQQHSTMSLWAANKTSKRSKKKDKVRHVTCHMDGLLGLKNATVGAYTVALGCRGLHLEADAPVRRVGQLQVWGHHIVEGAWARKWHAPSLQGLIPVSLQARTQCATHQGNPPCSQGDILKGRAGEYPASPRSASWSGHFYHRALEHLLWPATFKNQKKSLTINYVMHWKGYTSREEFRTTKALWSWHLPSFTICKGMGTNPTSPRIWCSRHPQCCTRGICLKTWLQQASEHFGASHNECLGRHQTVAETWKLITGIKNSIETSRYKRAQ